MECVVMSVDITHLLRKVRRAQGVIRSLQELIEETPGITERQRRALAQVNWSARLLDLQLQRCLRTETASRSRRTFH
jgi:hypothetical protein